MKNNKLTETEYEYMCVVWQHPEGIFGKDLFSYFTQAESTKRVIISRVVKKGFAEVIIKGKQALYRPLVDKLEYDRRIIEQELEKNMNIHFEKLFAFLCGKKELSEQQLKKLNNLISELSEEDE
ncbi:BlaI/MecI/CopY family transcriptional regulator [Lachnoclostridium pacaense]|uniref:BlaI/MecI/CopY family transcriptional regulator n=1 Tax=Enterocloster hominis (ex Hitch et al. 2024) TaxID=1917870 RepID=UPI001D107112|nr:BlaI/MecI/CopY family transcriptional regulator [Lachnoclostridium pacaense]MCC2816553.1 BlaI/MecI/CopY family transcriptional regulator [Lachnoclostridium pacaense]